MCIYQTVEYKNSVNNNIITSQLSQQNNKFKFYLGTKLFDCIFNKNFYQNIHLITEIHLSIILSQTLFENFAIKIFLKPNEIRG